MLIASGLNPRFCLITILLVGNRSLVGSNPKFDSAYHENYFYNDAIELIWIHLVNSLGPSFRSEDV